MENNIKGYCIITECLGGPELVWRVLEKDGDYPEIHETERGAQEAIAKNQIEHIEEFLTGDREYGDIDWNHDYSVAKISIDADGTLEVWNDSTGGHEHT